MTTIINAVSGTGLTQTVDGSGLVKLQSNGVATNALAWSTFNGTNGSQNASYNISSITRNSTGNYTVSFTSAMTDTNYCVLFGVCSGASGLNASFVGYVLSATQYGAPSNKTTTVCQIGFGDYTSTPRDFAQLYVAVFGN